MRYLLNLLVILCPVLIIASIWTGDGRWAATGAICGIPVVLAALYIHRTNR